MQASEINYNLHKYTTGIETYEDRLILSLKDVTCDIHNDKLLKTYQRIDELLTNRSKNND